MINLKPNYELEYKKQGINIIKSQKKIKIIKNMKIIQIIKRGYL